MIGNRTLEKSGAGETTVGRFEKEILLEGDNLNNLDEILQKMDREGRFGAWYKGNNIGHRQFRKSGVWGTGRVKLQWTFSFKVLSSIVCIQPVGEKAVLLGRLDMVKSLSRGTPSDVEKEVKRCIKDAAAGEAISWPIPIRSLMHPWITLGQWSLKPVPVEFMLKSV